MLTPTTLELGPTTLATSITGVSTNPEGVDLGTVATPVGIASADSELTRCCFLMLADSRQAASVFLFPLDLGAIAKSHTVTSLTRGEEKK